MSRCQGRLDLSSGVVPCQHGSKRLDTLEVLYLCDRERFSPLLCADDGDRPPSRRRPQDPFSTIRRSAAAQRNLFKLARHTLPPSLVPPLILSVGAASSSSSSACSKTLLDIARMHVSRRHRGDLGSSVVAQDLNLLLLVVQLLRRQDRLGRQQFRLGRTSSGRVAVVGVQAGGRIGRILALRVPRQCGCVIAVGILARAP